jgi:hypothetical protein
MCIKNVGRQIPTVNRIYIQSEFGTLNFNTTLIKGWEERIYIKMINFCDKVTLKADAQLFNCNVEFE